jgi:hypothetical protein
LILRETGVWRVTVGRQVAQAEDRRARGALGGRDVALEQRR